MTLWIVLTVMVAVAAAGLAVPLVRRYDRRAAEADAVLGVLRDQLADLDVQIASGAVAPGEAEGLRTELKRRVLAESRVGTGPADARRGFRPATSFRLALGSGVVVALAATGLYAVRGRPDLTTPAPVAAPEVASDGASAGGAPASPGIPPQVAAMVARLEARLVQSPRDPAGWQLLGASYFQLGRFDESAKAYAKAIALAPGTPGLQSALGEALVQAAGGVVTPAAKAAFTAGVAQDGRDPRARYFLAMLKDQQGDRRGALNDWVQLLRDAPADAPWAPELRKFAANAAAEQGLDLATLLAASGGTSPVSTGGARVATTPTE